MSSISTYKTAAHR